MWEIAFYAIGAAAAAAVALNLKGQLSEGGCASCPHRRACQGREACSRRAQITLFQKPQKPS